eukprot:TRINITY_DN1743_c0_g2_i5.p1 TRINITY_DN1743_c0_g2~~TRINITY_DN1743_c0_g2_i5.p1  ORF type:complete len:230 (+),score=55.25 TRINITY_DN1743_c0_g2_i5:285-974(+)
MAKRAVTEETKDAIQSEATISTSITAYNIGKWSESEHERFLKALKMFGNLWKKVRDYVGTRSCAQIRSHCQKYLRRKRNMKLQELRRTNSHKGMRFLVIQEYYNYAGSSTKHSSTPSLPEPPSVKRREEAEGEGAKKKEELESLELLNLEEPAEQPNDSLFELDGVESFGYDGYENEQNSFGSEFLLNGTSLYEQDSDINFLLDNHTYCKFHIEFIYTLLPSAYIIKRG